MAVNLIIQFIVAIFATIGFSIVFNAPKTELYLCGITGAIGWLVYYVLILFDFNIIAANIISTFVLTIFARVFAVRRQKPVTLYLLTGIFPLVPGAGIYYTAYYFFNGERTLFGIKGTETIEIAIAIVFGIIFGTAIPQILFNKLFGHQKKKS